MTARAHKTVTRRRRGFTLVEAVAAMVVVGAVAGVTAGLVSEGAQAYTDAARARESSERLWLALDRAVRFVREIPARMGEPGVPDILTAEADALVLGSGARLELIGTTLWFEDSSGNAAPLGQNIESFALEYLGDDGLPVDFAGGATTDDIVCIGITVRSAAIGLATRAFIRSTMGG